MGHCNADGIFQSRYIIFDDCVFSLSIAEMVSSGKGTFFLQNCSCCSNSLIFSICILMLCTNENTKCSRLLISDKISNYSIDFKDRLPL